MTISVDALQNFVVENGLAAKGSQAASDAAIGLMDLIRSEARGTGDLDRPRYNVHEFMQSLTPEVIRDNLRETRSGMVSIFCNVLGDFNLSSGVRNANWFNAHSVWIVGRKKWDRRGAVGTHNYTEVNYAPSMKECMDTLRADGYTIVAAEITDAAIPLTGYEWAEKTAVIYGEEGAGLSQEILDAVDAVIYIPGLGSVRSLNVATTSGIFLYDYHAKMGLIDT